MGQPKVEIADNCEPGKTRDLFEAELAKLN
jgi:hypothetical protein